MLKIHYDTSSSPTISVILVGMTLSSSRLLIENDIFLPLIPNIDPINTTTLFLGTFSYFSRYLHMRDKNQRRDGNTSSWFSPLSFPFNYSGIRSLRVTIVHSLDGSLTQFCVKTRSGSLKDSRSFKGPLLFTTTSPLVWTFYDRVLYRYC